jgi:hypothetical protein
LSSRYVLHLFVTHDCETVMTYLNENLFTKIGGGLMKKLFRIKCVSPAFFGVLRRAYLVKETFDDFTELTY